MVFTREDKMDEEKLKEVQSYREAFDHYDWNKNGKIPVKVTKKAQPVWSKCCTHFSEGSSVCHEASRAESNRY